MKSKNNYICSVYLSQELKSASVSFCDISTGELKVTDFSGEIFEVISDIKNEIGKFSPREILAYGISDAVEEIKVFISQRISCRFEILEKDISEDYSKELLKRHFKDIEKNIAFKINPILLKRFVFIRIIFVRRTRF